MEEYRSIDSITYEEFKEACESSRTRREVCEKLGVRAYAVGNPGGDRMTELSRKFGIEFPRATTFGNKRKNSPKLEFGKGKAVRHRALRRLLEEAGVLAVCSNSDCILHLNSSWRNLPITLHIDHIDGDRLNNTLENLRYLCPNCHSQTDTYTGRSVGLKNMDCECGRRRPKNLNYCPHTDDKGRTSFVYKDYCECGELKSKPAAVCKTCDTESRRTAANLRIVPNSEKFPELNELVEGIEKMGWAAYSRTLGITDNGLRKRMRKMGVSELPKGPFKGGRKQVFSSEK